MTLVCLCIILHSVLYCSIYIIFFTGNVFPDRGLYGSIDSNNPEYPVNSKYEHTMEVLSRIANRLKSGDKDSSNTNDLSEGSSSEETPNERESFGKYRS